MGAVGAQQAVAWWERWPDLEKNEMAAYAALGVPVNVAFRKNGTLILLADWPLEGRPPLKLEIRYSPLHPFVRPNVAAPEAELARHQHPIGKELCLLTQESHQWDSNQLVADFIKQQLARLFGALKAREEGRLDDAARLEEHAPDPLMPYYGGVCEPSSIVYFQGDMPIPVGNAGLLNLTVVPRPDERNPQAVEATVTRLRALDGNPIGFPLRLPGTDKDAIPAKGIWLRMKPPKDPTFQTLMDTVSARLEVEKKMGGERATRKINEVLGSALYFVGLVFPEEIAYGKTGTGWLFVIAQPKPNGKPGQYIGRRIRGERIGEEFLYARLPVASSLRTKKVLLVGTGAIGSFVALELARAGIGSLSLVDGDVALPGNSLRWPLGRPAWGLGKAKSLADFIQANYPWTKVSATEVKLGWPPSLAMAEKNAETEDERFSKLMAMLAEADIVIDTAASSEIQHALSFYAKEQGKPLIVANATFGAAGGLVARFRPDNKACWVCLHEHLNEGSIQRPNVDHAGEVLPVGCNEPTFTGGSFDLQEVSLEVVRSAVGLLSDGAYDPGAWDVAVLDLKGDDGRRILPSWRHYTLEAHASCCGRAS